MQKDRVASALKEVLEQGLSDGVAPGMACAIGDSENAYTAYAGRHSFDEASPSVDDRTLWDIASLTKIVATTNVVMAMHATGEIDLDDTVQRTVLEFVGDAKHEVTIRHLLEHTSGLPAFGDYTKHTNALEVKDEILRTELLSSPGKKETYSCLGFVALAEVIQRRDRLGLDRLFESLVAGPLGLDDTFYKPRYEDRVRCAPTETTPDWRVRLQDMRGFKRVSEEFVQGDVHDPIAFLTGGVSGNAGLFSTPADLAKVAQSWLRALAQKPVGRNGSHEAASIFNKSLMELFTTPRKAGTHALGFDTKSPGPSQAGTKFSRRTFGHTGYTGTRLWVDPEAGIFGALLTNRVCPSSENLKIMEFSPVFFDAVYDILRG